MDQNEITSLGTSLRRIDQKLLKTPANQEILKLWYQGGEPYFDLFVELEGKRILWLQLTLRGKSLSWNSRRRQWTTGKTNELQLDDSVMYPASKVIEPDESFDDQFLQLAQKILQTRAGEEVFDDMLTLLKEY